MGGTDRGSMDQREIDRLIAEAWRLREILDHDVPDSKYDPKVHLARRYSEIMGELLREAIVCRGVGRLESNQNGLALVFIVQEEQTNKWTTVIKTKVRKGG